MGINFIGNRIFIHGITRDEILNVIYYPLFQLKITSPNEEKNVILFIGNKNSHEPLIEVIANKDGDDLCIFHAMFLRRKTINTYDLEKYYPAITQQLIKFQRPLYRK